jgi:hypothetical protein
MNKMSFAVILPLLAFATCHAAQETKPLCDFENDDDMKVFVFRKPAELTEQHATHGAKSVKIVVGEYMVSQRLKDWSGFESLDIDCFLDSKEPMAVTLVVRDQAFSEKPTYWNRHNGGYNLVPGTNTISIPVNGLYRGEAGSRNGDIKANIDPSKIIQLELGFGVNKNKDANATVYVDNVRLTKEILPPGILAFDFGPESQTVFPGFAPITFTTVYGQNGNKAGLARAGWGKSIARDDTFPTRLYQDWIEMATDKNSREFVAEVPNGKYHVWVVYNDCGYWGGEQAKHRTRSITAEGSVAWSEDRGEAGPADHLFRFEKIEPKPGDSIWELYMKDVFKPRRFETTVADGTLNLVFDADTGFSSKVSAIIIYPDANKAEAEKWVVDVEDRNRKELETRALYVGEKPAPFEVPAGASAKGYWVGYPSLQDTITMESAPGNVAGEFARSAAKGQRVSYTFAVRALKDFGDVKLSCTDLKGPAGTLPASAADLRYIHYGTSRDFNGIAWKISPHTLRPVADSGLKLTRDVTRQFWITLAAPNDAKPGIYTGQVTLNAGALTHSIAISIEVLDLALDEPDFAFGFFGVHVPGQLPAARQTGALKELLTLFKQNGMNSFTGGPGIKFTGFDAGKPVLDFTACDEYFKVVKECGYTKEIQSYGGPGMVEGLHSGYEIGDAGRGWEKKTGKPFTEVLKIVWGAVKEHAEKNDWPQIGYNFTDEPRVLETAKAQLELMKAYREAVPFVRIGGSYSVHWDETPLNKAIQDIFKTLVWSGLNVHTQKDLDMAKEFGREVYVYNQGSSRYSFGMYQWAEMRKGVKGRQQWHAQCLHGFQFFDLDGREPDTSAITWGSKEIYPTIVLPRCREGADDFRFAVTLWNLAEKKKGSPDADAALAFLEDINKKIGVAVRNPPKDMIDDETFRNTCIQHIKKLQGK